MTQENNNVDKFMTKYYIHEIKKSFVGFFKNVGCLVWHLIKKLWESIKNKIDQNPARFYKITTMIFLICFIVSFSEVIYLSYFKTEKLPNLPKTIVEVDTIYTNNGVNDTLKNTSIK
jgi:hypothetical protein